MIEAVGAESRATGAAPLIELSGVGFTYPDGTCAIEELSLSLPRGQITAIVGPSGCGKTTLLRLLAALREPTRGTIERSFGDDGERHGCSMVFQEDTLLPWLRVRDNVGLYFRFRRRKGKQVDERVDRLLEMVGLREYADAFPVKLSGGMRRRVALLTAIAPMPSLLLLDEPFSALDEPTRMALHNELHALVREFEVGTILVTHDLAEAITLADRVIMLSRAPARIVGTYEIPFGHRRDVFALRGRPDYLELYGALWAGLEREIRAVPGQQAPKSEPAQ